MSRFIDADELLNKLPDDLPYKASVKRVLMQAPTADVVEVVRCRDCKHFTEGMAIGMCKRDEYKPILPINANHYCSYGKRRANDE